MSSKLARAKLSTTVASETHEYLAELVRSGRAKSIAEAVDYAVRRMRSDDNRQRLARATAEYYASMPDDEMAEENSLAVSLHQAASKVDFECEL